MRWLTAWVSVHCRCVRPHLRASLWRTALLACVRTCGRLQRAGQLPDERVGCMGKYVASCVGAYVCTCEGACVHTCGRLQRAGQLPGRAAQQPLLGGALKDPKHRLVAVKHVALLVEQHLGILRGRGRGGRGREMKGMAGKRVMAARTFIAFMYPPPTKGVSTSVQNSAYPGS